MNKTKKQIEKIIKSVETLLAKWEPYIVNRSITTNSVYMKFCSPALGSLRIGDHNGKEKYAFKWRIRTDLHDTAEVFEDKKCMCSQYSSDRLKDFVQDFNRLAKERDIDAGGKEEIIELCGEIIHSTNKAWLFLFEGAEYWLPKSSVTEDFKDGMDIIKCPKWIIESKGIAIK